jgi:transposase, IS5 family
VSLSDPDARPIRKGRPRAPTEFGYRLLVAECARGVLADHQLQQGNPPDAPQLIPAVKRVAELTGWGLPRWSPTAGSGPPPTTGRWPSAASGGSGRSAKGTLSAARAALERTSAFRRLRNWRVGIEARSSHLKRAFGLGGAKLCRLGGARTWVGLGIFADNLQRMTVVMAAR